jgi:hypothetical protein
MQQLFWPTRMSEKNEVPVLYVENHSENSVEKM